MHDGALLDATVVVPDEILRDRPKLLLVTHKKPDTDALACIWFIIRFVMGPNADYEIQYVRAGERLSEAEEAGYSQVIYVDTGGGDTDQHGKSLTRSSSFKLLVEKFQPEVDPALLPIIELTVATDNVEEMSPTSIQQVFLGLPHYYRENSPETDWSMVISYVFIALDVLYDREKARLKSETDLQTQATMITLPNGMVICDVGFRPRLRGAAFAKGADVVIWMAPVGKNKFHPGIQVNRKHMRGDSPKLSLWAVLEELRRAEAKARCVSVRGLDLRQMQPIAEVGAWFGHDSGGLVACGTKTHTPTDAERTVLPPGKIREVVLARLTGFAWNTD